MPPQSQPARLVATLIALSLAAPPAQAQTAPPAPDETGAADPVTEAQVRQLRETGLIARQTQIGEGLLLMDRQLRQAQLAQQVIALLGVDEPVEVAPGEFRDFSDTPLGIRERIQQLQLELQLLEMTEQVEQARAESGGARFPLSALLGLRPSPEAIAPQAAPAPAAAPAAGAPADPPPDPQPAQPEPATAPPEPEISVRELRGAAGRYSALLRIDRVDMVAEPGTELPGGIAVVAVQPLRVVLRMPGGGLKSYPAPN